MNLLKGKRLAVYDNGHRYQQKFLYLYRGQYVVYSAHNVQRLGTREVQNEAPPPVNFQDAQEALDYLAALGYEVVSLES